MAKYLRSFLRKHLEKIQTALVPQALAAIGEGVTGRLNVYREVSPSTCLHPYLPALEAFSLESAYLSRHSHWLSCRYATWRLVWNYRELREVNGTTRALGAGWQVRPLMSTL